MGASLFPAVAPDRVAHAMSVTNTHRVTSRGYIETEHAAALAAEVERLRGRLDESDALVLRLERERDEATADGRAAGRAESAAEVLRLRAEVDRLREQGEQEAEHLAWSILREQAVRDAWRSLTDAQRADVPAALAEELDELCEHLDGTSRTERELARLRAVEKAARRCAQEFHDYGDEASALRALRAALKGGA